MISLVYSSVAPGNDAQKVSIEQIFWENRTKINVQGNVYPSRDSSRKKCDIMPATTSDETSCALRGRRNQRKGYGVGFTRVLRVAMAGRRVARARGLFSGGRQGFEVRRITVCAMGDK